MNDDDKEILAQKLEIFAEDIRRLPHKPLDIQIDLIIKGLFEEVMCELKHYKQ